MLKNATVSNGTIMSVPVTGYRTLTVPGSKTKAKLGVCYIKVTDLPNSLDDFMSINPRVPNRNKEGLLKGPVAKGIMETLENRPTEMALMNQGIYMLVEQAEYNVETHKLALSFVDKGKHGIINGGHTYAAIREAVDHSTPENIAALQNAYVQLHILQGIEEEQVAEIAEGLNRSKQVDDPSLANLQGEFDVIRKAFRGTRGESEIAYHQGDSGSVYISEVLVYLSLFNSDRFDNRVHPNGLYNKQSLGLKYFEEDMKKDRAFTLALISKLPEFFMLADWIKQGTPQAAKANNFKFGRAKISTTDRAGSIRNKGIPLHFSGGEVNYRVPNGWLYPMLAAFRANLVKNGTGLRWLVPLEEIVPEVINELVGICVSEHRDNNMRPELIGKRESAYSQCYSRVELFLAKKGLLK